MITANWSFGPVLVVLLCLTARTALAGKAQAPGESPFAAWMREGDQAMDAGRTYAALEDYGKALELADASGDFWMRVAAANNYATALMAFGDYGGAHSRLQQALALYGEAGLSDERLLATCLDNLAVALQQMGQLREAERVCRRGLELRLGCRANGEEAGYSWNTLSGILIRRRMWDEARQALESALACWRGAKEDHRKDLAVTLNNYASLEFERKRYYEAEPWLRQSIETLEAIYGSQHPNLTTPYCNLAALHLALGDLEGAERRLRKALELRDQPELGEGADLAQALYGLAVVQHAQRRLSEAARLHLRALEMRERLLGPNHPSLAESLRGYSRVLRDLDRGKEARAANSRAKAILASR